MLPTVSHHRNNPSRMSRNMDIVKTMIIERRTEMVKKKFDGVEEIKVHTRIIYESDSKIRLAMELANRLIEPYQLHLEYSALDGGNVMRVELCDIMEGEA